VFEKNWLKSANRLKTLRNIAEAIAHEYTLVAIQYGSVKEKEGSKIFSFSFFFEATLGGLRISQNPPNAFVIKN